MPLNTSDSAWYSFPLLKGNIPWKLAVKCAVQRQVKQVKRLHQDYKNKIHFHEHVPSSRRTLHYI